MIGLLTSRGPGDTPYLLAAFRYGLKDSGVVEGQNVTIEYRFAGKQTAAWLAADLVNRQVTMIVATTTVATLAAKAASTIIPIVFEMGGDPIRFGAIREYDLYVFTHPGEDSRAKLEKRFSAILVAMDEGTAREAAIAFCADPMAASLHGRLHMISALLYATTVLTGGFVWFATKFQLGVVPPEISLIYRFSVAALLLTGFAAVLRQPLKFGIAVHFRLVLFAALVFGGNFALLYAAIENLTSGLVAIIFSTSVLMNIAFGVVFLGRKIEGVVVIGALLGVCGLGFIFHADLLQLTSSNVRTLAIVQALTATMLFSLGNMVSAGLQAERIPALVSTAFAMAYGTLLLLVYAVVSGKPFLLEISQGYILSLIYLTIFGSVIGYATYFTLLGRIGPERTAYTTVLVPALALGVSTVFEGFTWSSAALVGAGLIFTGNAVILWKQQPSPPLKREAG